MKGFFYALLLRILFEAELTFLSVAYQSGRGRVYGTDKNNIGFLKFKITIADPSECFDEVKLGDTSSETLENPADPHDHSPVITGMDWVETRPDVGPPLRERLHLREKSTSAWMRNPDSSTR